MFGKKKSKKAKEIDQPEEGSDDPFFAMPLSDEQKLTDDQEIPSDPDQEEEDSTSESEAGLATWINEEDKLPIDVYQDESYVYLKSPVPGADVKDIDITIDNDLITIRIKREQEEMIEQDDYFFQECYWGSLSRSIILPADIKADAVEATLRNGILIISLPKVQDSTVNKISVNILE